LKEEYQQLFSEDIRDIAKIIRQIVRIRDKDLGDFRNLPNVFIRGRKVDKVPSASTDTTGDRPGDFNYSTSYLYICVNNAGTATWRRAALSSW